MGDRSPTRGDALDKAAPSYHRALPVNVLALGRQNRDLDSIRDAIKWEHDPDVVSAALKRAGALIRDIADQSRRVIGMEATVAYPSWR